MVKMLRTLKKNLGKIKRAAKSGSAMRKRLKKAKTPEEKVRLIGTWKKET